MANTDVGIRVVVLGAAQASRILGNVRDDLSRFSREIVDNKNQMERFGASVVKVGDSLSSVGRTMTYTISAPLMGAIAGLTAQGIKFEEAFAGVAKTVPGVAKGFEDIAKEMYGTSEGLTKVQKDAVFANQSFGDLKQEGLDLRNNFRDLALQIPISATELAKVGQVAGQLGVRGTEQITQFTKVMAQLGTATDLNAEQAAFAIARFANIMGVSETEIGNFAEGMGNSLVALGNNAAATESEITDMALRLASAGRAANMTSPQILGVSAALTEMGVKAERGGTAVSRLLYEMIYSIADGGDEVKQFAEIAGMSVSDFSAYFKRDAVGAMQIFLKRLSDLQDAGLITADTMNTLGLSGVRVREVVGILGPNLEVMRKDIDLANKGWQDQIALQEEVTKRYKTIASVIQLTKNTLADLGITIFDLVRDDIANMLKGIQSVAKYLRELDDGVLKSAIKVGVFVSAIGPLLLVLGTLTQLTGNSIIGLGKLQKSFTGLLSLPFKMFNPFASLFGGKDKKGNTKFSLGLIGRGTSFITDIFKKISKNMVAPVAEFMGEGLKDAFSFMFKGAKFATSSAGDLIKSFIGALKTGLNIISPITGILTPILKIPLTLVEKSIGVFGKLLGGSLGLAYKGLGKFAGLLGDVIGKLPGFGSGLIKFIISPLGKLPQLLALVAGAFALMLGPKIISQFVKNKDKVFDELKTSAKQFKDDLSNLGIEKSILLFFSGGSTGSGRQGGLRGLALALGASEEHANKFSYAMGTAAYWVIKIVKDTGKLIRNMFKISSKTDEIGGKTKTTGDRLISFAQSLAKFFEGFSVGWAGSFDEIIDATKVFAKQLGKATEAVKRLFDTIFGRVKDTNNTLGHFYDSLEPGAESTASRVGATIGSILGDLVTIAVQGMTIITGVVTSLINAATQLVAAYKEGGIKGVFEELGPAIATVFDGFLVAAGTIWDVVKPKLETFVDSAVSWLQTDGVDSLKAGAESLWSVLSSALDSVLFGTEAKTQTKYSKYVKAMTLTANGQMTGEYSQILPEDKYYQQPDWWLKTHFPMPIDIPSTTTTPGSEGLLSKLQTMVSDAYDYLTSEDTKNTVWNAINDVLNWVGSQLSTAWDTIQPYANTLWNSVKDWVNNTIIPEAKQAGSDMVQALIDGIESKITEKANTSAFKILADYLGILKETNDEVQQTGNNFDAEKVFGPNAEIPPVPKTNSFLTSLTTLSKQINDIFNAKELETQFNSVPDGIISGLNTGITEGAPSVTSTVQGMADSLVATTKTALQVFSPSQVFYRIGQAVVQGLTQGMISTTGMLSGVMSNIIGMFSNLLVRITTYSSLIQAQVKAIQTQITALQAASNVVQAMAKNVFGTTVNNSVTTNNNKTNTYAPNFYGPPDNKTQSVNNNLYSQWVAVG